MSKGSEGRRKEQREGGRKGWRDGQREGGRNNRGREKTVKLRRRCGLVLECLSNIGKNLGSTQYYTNQKRKTPLNPPVPVQEPFYKGHLE